MLLTLNEDLRTTAEEVSREKANSDAQGSDLHTQLRTLQTTLAEEERRYLTVFACAPHMVVHVREQA